MLTLPDMRYLFGVQEIIIVNVTYKFVSLAQEKVRPGVWCMSSQQVVQYVLFLTVLWLFYAFTLLTFLFLKYLKFAQFVSVVLASSIIPQYEV